MSTDLHRVMHAVAIKKHGDAAAVAALAGLPQATVESVLARAVASGYWPLFRFDPTTREMMLASAHPGVTVEEVRAQTGWPLRLAGPVVETPPPSPGELATVRRFDPEGFWTGARR